MHPTLPQELSCGKVGCITLQVEEARPRGEGEHGGRGDSILQCIEGLLLSCAPQPVLRLPSEHVEGVSDFGEVLDEPSVEVHKSYEGLDILYFHQLWPVHDSLDFNGVDGEKCRTVHYQPKQPKTLLVLNQGGAGYETEADLCIKLNRQLIPFQTHRLVTGTQTGHRHPSFRTKHNKT